MDTLPLEMQDYILSFLEMEMKLFARLVCKEWRELIRVEKVLNMFNYLVRKRYGDLIEYLVRWGHTEDLEDYLLQAGNEELLQRFQAYISGNALYTYHVDRKNLAFFNNHFNGRIIPFRKGYYSTSRSCASIQQTMEQDNLEEFCRLVNFHTRKEVKSFFLKAIIAGAGRCLKYMHKRYSCPKTMILSSNGRIGIFLLTHEYVKYSRMLSYYMEDQSMLAWLRGEKEIAGIVYSPPPWPENFIMLTYANEAILKWIRGDRLHGKCPWDQRYLELCIRDDKIELLRLSCDLGCPLDEEIMRKAILKKKGVVVAVLREKGCPWPKDIDEIQERNPAFFHNLAEMGIRVERDDNLG